MTVKKVVKKTPIKKTPIKKAVKKAPIKKADLIIAKIKYFNVTNDNVFTKYGKVSPNDSVMLYKEDVVTGLTSNTKEVK